MSIRLPLQGILDQTHSTSSVATTAYTFTLPQDVDNVVVKLSSVATTGGGVSATLQTTDDGGTTWYDIARTSVVSAANGTTAEWITAATISHAGAIGRAGASTLGTGAESQLPILSPLGRVQLIYSTAGMANGGVRVQVLTGSQSPRA